MSREVEPLVLAFSHEKQRPREKDALHTLQKIASLVKPIMRARNWKVGTLCEFFPDQQNLLGLNVNKGQKICLRLRYPGDASQFLPMEQVVDTMLHELSHNVFGPHDAKFHALWDQLRDEYDGLLRKGYTGEGFLSEGRKLGGRSVPRDEARRIARAAAEKRRTLTSGSGQKLGGAPLRAGHDIRKIITDAVERRNRVTKGCGATDHNDEEIQEIGNRATASGFRTKAEEDKANEDAIAQALWELMQEDQQAKYGDNYIQPSASYPSGNISDAASAPSEQPRSSPPQKRSKTEGDARNLRNPSRLVPEYAPIVPTASKPVLSSNNPFKPLTNANAQRSPQPAAKPDPASDNPFFELKSEPENWKGSRKWVCPTCTCHNPDSFLCCDACTAERPVAEAREYVYENGKKARPAARPSSKPVPRMWTCHACGNRMEEQWWTCSACETMKLKS